ncbi:MAG TPA: HD domain-containing phosphohydrolase [Minicystis sp.]|nr:HD domain-containing phosphohydrolase [Minicystis sp.]
MVAKPPGTNQRIADRLLADGRITREQHARAVEYATRLQGRIEDAMCDLGVIGEADLLKYVATLHKTKFVSTEKLAKAVIDPRLLARVPAKLAELYGIFPVLVDDAASALSIVTADPDDAAAQKELKLAARVRDVRPFVARPAAVRAAILAHYRGDKRAFEAITRPLGLSVELGNEDPFEARGSALPSAPVARAAMPAPPPRPKATTSPKPPAAKRGITSPREAVVEDAPARATPVPPDVNRPSVPVLNLPAPVVTLPPTATHEFIETLNVLVSLLENARADLRGHSATVARLAKKTAERIGLSQAHTSAYVAAAYLHDLGKMGAYHLTALNVAEYEGHRIAAMKAVDLPVHLMESVGLLPETASAITSMYERYDGRGIPNGQAAKEIPLGARVLAVVDTYADLTQNPRNPYRKILRPFEACEVLAQYKGQVFDPNIVDLFRQAMTGDDMRAKLLSERHLALIVDPDPEETTVLELRMIEQGFEVRIARTIDRARRELESGEITIVVSEIDLDQPDGGFTLRQAARGETWGRDVTWVMLTSKADRQSAQRAFDLGVDDFVSKPAATDLFVAKLRQLIERRAARSGGRGVAGSLAEMSLPDMVQILWHGRKTCALRIRGSAGAGEIDFADGQVINAKYDAFSGEEAFYRLIALKEGDFQLDPSYKPGPRVISSSPEALLLEGMRRLDEGTLSA